MSANGRRRQGGMWISLFCCVVPATQIPREALGAKVWRSTTWNQRGRVLLGFSAVNNVLQLFDTNGSSLSKNLNRGIIQTRCWFPSTFLFLPLLCCTCYLLKIECVWGKSVCLRVCVGALSDSLTSNKVIRDNTYSRRHRLWKMPWIFKSKCLQFFDSFHTEGVLKRASKVKQAGGAVLMPECWHLGSLIRLSP